MKRVYVILFVSSILFLFGTRDNHVLAHGVHYTIDKAETMVIKVEYDDGEPAGYAEVKIFSPDDQKIEYQKGRTDKNGQFSFLPDKKGGEWKIMVSDGMGHGVVAKVTPDSKGNTGIAVQSSGLKKWQKAIMALSVAFGFIGLAFFLQARVMRKGMK